jgi:hypothetical protein
MVVPPAAAVFVVAAPSAGVAWVPLNDAKDTAEYEAAWETVNVCPLPVKVGTE